MRFAAVLAVCALCFCAGASIAEEALELPYLPGETWLCSRGYNTATHRDYGYAWVDDRYALDFVLSGCNAYGRPILAVQSGVVKEAGKNDSYGRYLLIESPDGKRNRYGHNCQLVVGKGEWVKQGQVISFCGNTGVVEGHACTAHAGTHLHYVWYDDSGDGLKPEPISGNSDMREDIYYTSRNTNLFDMAYSRYGEAMIGQSEYQMWDVNTARRANPNHPWYNAWEPSSLYDARGMPQNCVVWNFDGGFFGDNAIVYDALGGARSAVVLHSGLWMFWTQRGGPINPAKMPIKDESNVPSNLRSYYHDHYKEHVGDRINLLDGITAIQECTDGCIVWANGQAHFVYYPFCAPGYYEDGWHKDTSYLFVECFNRHGGSQNVGHAIPGGSGTARVHDWGGYDVQDFQSPNGTRWVFFYDSNGAIHNPSCNTNEAYAVTGPILDHFGRNGDVAKYGCPTIDQFEINGHTAQDFYEWRSGKHWRLEYNGNNVEEIDLARCIGGDLVKATTGCTTSTDNLIANGNFASCLDCFDFHVEAGHPWASYETENAVCRIGFNNTDPARKYNDGWLYQGNLVLNPAKRYVLSGDISGDCGDAVTIAIGGETSGTWSLWQDRMPAWTDKHFSYIFQPQSADPTFALYLFFGRVHSSVWIGDLRLTEYVPPAPCTPDPNNMIANHDFRNRTDCLDIRVWPPEHGEINFATNLIEIVVRGNNSDIWSAQMAFLLYTITAGQRYAIEYEQQNVKSFETYVGLSDFENGQYYDCGFAEAYVQPPEAWVPHRYEFVAKRTTSVAKLAFGFGRIDGSMFRLRPIRMYPISTPPLTCVLDPNSYIGNGNFTSGVACWTPRYINLQWPGFTVQDDHSARLDVNGG
ncbi:MAG: M23 family metallopeptidase, partial [Patescibacteria group bacterium]